MHLINYHSIKLFNLYIFDHIDFRKTGTIVKLYSHSITKVMKIANWIIKCEEQTKYSDELIPFQLQVILVGRSQETIENL